MSARRVADDEERVAELLELALEHVGVEPGALDDEDRAVAELGELLVDRVDRGRGCLRGRLRHLLARDGGANPADDLDEPGAARVDDTCLGQDREQLRCPGERLLAPGDDEAEQLGAVEVRASGASAASAISRITVSMVPSTGRRTAR